MTDRVSFLERIRKHFARTDMPMGLTYLIAVFTAVVALIISVPVQRYLDRESALDDLIVSEYLILESEAKQFEVLFESFSSDIMEMGDVNEEKRSKVVANLVAQSALVERIKPYVPVEQEDAISNYQDALYDVQKSVRSVEGFDDLKSSFKKVVQLLGKQKRVLQSLRERIGVPVRRRITNSGESVTDRGRSGIV